MYNIEQELKDNGLSSSEYEAALEDCSMKLNKESDVSWNDIIDKYGLSYSSDSLRKAQQLPLFGGSFVRDYYIDKMVNFPTLSESDEYVKNETEKKKVQTVKLEYNKWLRENARDELIVERIVDAIKTLEPLPKVAPHPALYNDSGDEHVLLFGDAHFGAEFEIRDMANEVINAYSPEIFYSRMYYLMNRVIEIIKKEHINTLNVVDLGDNIDGIIRLTSQLMKLRYGILESTMRYADFMSDWLNELSKYVKIRFNMVLDGNHTQLRICGAPKNAFPEENVGKVILWHMKERLKDNDNIEIIDNVTGSVYFKVCDYNVVAIHGEVKDMPKALDEYSKLYDMPISYLYAGHYHHDKYEEISKDCAVHNIPSVIGTDPYSISLRRKSNAGAVLDVYHAGRGRTMEYDIKLSEV